MDGDAWWATVHGVKKSRTRLSNFTYIAPQLKSLFQWRTFQWNVKERMENCWILNLSGHRTISVLGVKPKALCLKRELRSELFLVYSIYTISSGHITYQLNRNKDSCNSSSVCVCVCVCVCSVTQSCPTLCDHMDCSLPGSSVHGDSPGKNTGVGCQALLQGIFPTQELNQDLLHCRWMSTQPAHYIGETPIINSASPLRILRDTDIARASGRMKICN